MERAKQHYNPNPMMKANFISKLFYWWLNPLLSLGYKKTLNQEDLFNVLNDDSSDILRERLTSEWEKEMLKLKHSGKPSLSWAIFRTVYKKYFLWLCVVSIDEFSKVIQPLLLGQLVSYFIPNSRITTQQAYLYGMGVVICVLLSCLSNHIFFFNVHRIGMQIRIACCSLMFKKMLSLNNKSLNKTAAGQIVNLMSNDVNRFDQVLLYAHFFIVGPPQTIAIIIILWYILGPVCLLGFLVLIVIIPLQVWMGKLVSKYRCKTAIFTDQRMALMNEIIAGMRILKMYCWEIPYGKLVKEVRRTSLLWNFLSASVFLQLFKKNINHIDLTCLGGSTKVMGRLEHKKNNEKQLESEYNNVCVFLMARILYHNAIDIVPTHDSEKQEGKPNPFQKKSVTRKESIMCKCYQ